METMVFKTDLTLHDYKSLCKLQTKASTLIGSLAGGFFVCFVFMRLLAWSVPLLATVAFAGCVIVYFAIRLYINWRASRIYAMSNVSDLLTLTLNDEGIIQQAQSGELKLEWDDVYKVVEVKDCYFMFLTRNKAFYFPKRSFESKDHEKLFVEWVVDKIHPGRIKFKRG